MPAVESRFTWDAIHEAVRKGQVDVAREGVRGRLVESPQDPVAISWLARIEYESGNQTEAINLLADVDIDTPEYGIPAAGLRATWLIATGEFEAALAQLRSIQSRMPGEALVHRQLAQVLNLIGRRQEAASHVRELCILGDVTQNELASLLSIRLPFDTRESNALFGEGDTAAGQQWTSGLAQARVLLERGASHAALSMMRDAVNRMNKDAEATRDPWMISLFGRTAVELNDDHAVTAWLASLSPEVARSADHWCALGLLAGRPDIGRFDEAAQFSRMALKLDPTDWSTCAYLEGLMTQIGDFGQANDYRERALWIQNSLLASNRLAASGKDNNASATMQSLIDTLRSLDRDLEATLWAIIRARQTKAVKGDRAETVLAEELQRLQETRSSRETPGSPLFEEQESLIALADAFLDEIKPRFLTTLDRNTLSQNTLGSKGAIGSGDPTTADSKSDVAIRWKTYGDNRGISFRYANADPVKNRDFQLYEQFGGGVAAFDYDWDGNVDLYFPQAAGTPNQRGGKRPNELFRQVDQGFDEVALTAGCDDRGYGLGVAV
ncbi:MAG: hypothetical protein AAGD07_22325, partial [Planctomycetota bacterium]